MIGISKIDIISGLITKNHSVSYQNNYLIARPSSHQHFRLVSTMPDAYYYLCSIDQKKKKKFPSEVQYE